MEQLQKIHTHFFESLRYIFFQTVRRKKPFRNRGYSPLSIPRAVGRLHARARVLKGFVNFTRPSAAKLNIKKLARYTQNTPTQRTDFDASTRGYSDTGTTWRIGHTTGTRAGIQGRRAGIGRSKVRINHAGNQSLPRQNRRLTIVSEEPRKRQATLKGSFRSLKQMAAIC